MLKYFAKGFDSAEIFAYAKTLQFNFLFFIYNTAESAQSFFITSDRLVIKKCTVLGNIAILGLKNPFP